MNEAFLAVLLAGQEVARSNPLASIDATAPQFFSQCNTLARQLLARALSEPTWRWSPVAELILTAIIAFVCADANDAEDRTLLTVRLIVGDSRKLDRSFEVMTKSSHPIVAELGTWGTSTSAHPATLCGPLTDIDPAKMPDPYVPKG